jgi:hypothetical protein
MSEPAFHIHSALLGRGGKVKNSRLGVIARSSPERAGVAGPPATMAPPGPGSTPTNPLARLGGYELRHLVSHLAVSGHANELKRLLFLRAGSTATLWFAAAPTVRVCLSDLDRSSLISLTRS